MKPSMDWQRTPERLKASQRSPEIEIASERERMEAVWRQRAVRLARRPVPAGAGPNALPHPLRSGRRHRSYDERCGEYM